MHNIHDSFQPWTSVHRYQTGAYRERVSSGDSIRFNTLVTFTKPRNLSTRAGGFRKATPKLLCRVPVSQAVRHNADRGWKLGYKGIKYDEPFFLPVTT